MIRNVRPTVVKLGGSLLEIPQQRNVVLESISALWRVGVPLVLVHGGGQRVDKMLSRLNIPQKTHQGLRVTDSKTLEVVISVLSGLVNKVLIADFSTLGIVAAGFSGADGRTLVADFHPEVDGVKLGFVGQIKTINSTLIRSVLFSRMLPILSPIAIGPDGTLLNINADRVASALAVSLQAQRLLFLTDVEGLLDSNGCIVPKLTFAETQRYLQSDFVNGGMRPKLNACLEAMVGGVPEIIIAGPNRHSAAISCGEGGTLLVAA